MCTLVSVDGVVIPLQASSDTVSDFETPRQQMPTSTLGVTTSIDWTPTVVLAGLLELSALKIELLAGS